ncbi:MAG: PilZ domain-containing protein [Desulfobacterales bacterium]|nr:PilZ domain-containing protein [Desulfobacterales bacterium]
MAGDKKQFLASGITARLFEAISRMTEPQKEELLLLIGEQREYIRLPYLMQIMCETDDRCFNDFILDISPGGIFLETIQELFAGQKLTMDFQFKGVEKPVRIIGSVAWLGKNGAGIRFLYDSKEQKQLITDYIELLR